MIPIQRNVLLEIQDSPDEYEGGFIKPKFYQKISGKLKLVSCSRFCSPEIKALPPGTEVILDYDSEELKENIWETAGSRFFVIRENFISGYFIEPEEDQKSSEPSTSQSPAPDTAASS